MKPLIRSGFGSFNYVVGPWQDYFPSQPTQADSQFGVCVGTEINGGTEGATISAITMEAPFNIVGGLATHPWRCLVIRGRAPLDIHDLQLSTRGWPRQEANMQDILWAKMIAAKLTANAYNTTNVTESHMHFIFPDNTGPSCGPGETMTVLFFPLFNDTGAAPVYGAGNFTSVSLSVFGSFSRGRNGNDSESNQTGRSIPQGLL